MGVGTLELRTRPLVLAIDTWPMRGADLGHYKPAEFTVQARDRGQAAVLDAIARTAAEGDHLARLEARGHPIPELAERYWTARQVTVDDLSVRFLTLPAIAWGGGGIEMRYRPAIDLLV
ncbi:MAG: DUF6470 family protein [Bacillota bacterium]|nr:DUF6470 family protein [Bacillota bacterium]